MQSNSNATQPAESDKTPASNEPATPVVQQKPVNKPTKAGWMKDADGTWYYFTGVNAKPSTGWIKTGGKWYWLQPDKNGAMASNTWVSDKGKEYYVTSSGAMATGWVKNGSEWYYANGTGAKVTGGWIKAGGKWYWLQSDKKGLMASNTWVSDKGKEYYVTSSGAMATGWVKNGSEWYYANGIGAKVTGGWIKAGGKWYWLQSDKKGLMASNTWVADKGKEYYVTSSGAMATGWVKNGSEWYYANGTGAKVTGGWIKAGGKWYWLQSDKKGAMISNQLKDIEGKKYSFDGNGAMRSHCQVDLGNSAAGYAADSGAITRIGTFKDGKLVLTDANGKVLSGWQKVAGLWFYGASGSGIAHTGWLKLGSSWYYMDGSAAMVTGTRTIDGKVNLFNGSGRWLGTNALATKAQGYFSNTNKLIVVDRGNHKVGVFSGSQNNWTMDYEWSCVTGAPGTPTITGSFLTTGGKVMTLTTDSRAHYCTQISGGYFFHTILASDSELGHSLSHGCIRLAYPNAQWIYSNIKAGTRVVIFN